MDQKWTTWTIFQGARADLALLDFSIKNLRFLELSSPEMQGILKSPEIPGLLQDTLKDLCLITYDSEGFPVDDLLFILLPIDSSKEVHWKDRWECLHILQLMFPSDFHISDEIDFHTMRPEDRISSFTHRPQMRDDISDPLTFDLEYLAQINSFIKLFYERFPSIKYIHPAFSAYANSFSQADVTLRYLSLCICLESVVSGRGELTYRLRRNTAILVGQDEEHANLIYDNVNKLYALRSSIVHSGKYETMQVWAFMPYLRNLASLLLREIILHNIPDLDKLNTIITKLGFGDKEKISTAYSPMDFNPKILMASREKLEKKNWGTLGI